MKKLKFFLFILLAGACNPTPELDNFDSSAWKSDKYGCNGDRIKLVEQIRENQENLKGIDQRQLIELMGKPDEQELYQRSQKYFTYYLDPGPECDVPALNPLKLQIRFNALGLSNEVVIKR